MRLFKTLIFFIVLINLSSCCVPAPWKAWRYEHRYKFDYPAPWNLPSIEKFKALYVDGAFVNIRVMAHDETTNSGSPPYQLIIPILTNKNEHQSVTFHSIVISSSLGDSHVVTPITVNKAAEKVGNLIFPVNLKFKLFANSVINPSPIAKEYYHAALWSDVNLELIPDKGEEIKISIDIEVHKPESSKRKVVEYEFYPCKDSGIFQCISV